MGPSTLTRPARRNQTDYYEQLLEWIATLYETGGPV